MVYITNIPVLVQGAVTIEVLSQSQSISAFDVLHVLVVVTAITFLVFLTLLGTRKKH